MISYTHVLAATMSISHSYKLPSQVGKCVGKYNMLYQHIILLLYTMARQSLKFIEIPKTAQVLVKSEYQNFLNFIFSSKNIEAVLNFLRRVYNVCK